MRSIWIYSSVLSVALSCPLHATPDEQVDYMLNCQGCHLPDGRGFPARNVPDMRAHLAKFLWVKGGREFIVQVPGSAQSDLDDDALARVLNWMLRTFSASQVPADFSPYTAVEVGMLRQSPLIDVSNRRQQLIHQITEYEHQR